MNNVTMHSKIIWLFLIINSISNNNITSPSMALSTPRQLLQLLQLQQQLLCQPHRMFLMMQQVLAYSLTRHNTVRKTTEIFLVHWNAHIVLLYLRTVQRGKPTCELPIRNRLAVPCAQALSPENSISKNIISQFMKENDRTHALQVVVTKHLDKSIICPVILRQFMRNAETFLVPYATPNSRGKNTWQTILVVYTTRRSHLCVYYAMFNTVKSEHSDVI